MKKLFLSFLLLGLLSCGEDDEKLPPGLVPPGELTSILADIHVLESQVDAMQLPPDTAQVFFKRQQLEVLKKHDVSKAEFDTTYNYYLGNIRQLDKIYEALVDTLSMREIKLTKNKPAVAQPPTPADTTALK